MKQTIKKMLLALMVSIGMMGAVSVQAQEKVMVRVSGLCHSDRGCFDNGEAFCDAVIAGIYERRPGWEWSGSRVVCNIQHEIFGASTTGVIVQCPKGWVDQSRFGCYEQQSRCPAGTVNEGGVCVEPEDKCDNGKEKDESGNCVCPSDSEELEGVCYTKCPPGQGRYDGLVCSCPPGEELVGDQCLKECPPDQIRDGGSCKNKPCTMYYVAGHLGTESKNPEDACGLWGKYVPQGYIFNFVSYAGGKHGVPEIPVCVYKRGGSSSLDWHTRPMEQRTYTTCPE